MYLTLDIDKASRDTENYLIINRIVTEHELGMSGNYHRVQYCNESYSKCGSVNVTELIHVRYCDMTGQLEGMRVLGSAARQAIVRQADCDGHRLPGLANHSRLKAGVQWERK